MTGCPNTTENGCRCPDHDPGLGAYAADPVAYEAALAPLRPVRLHVVTPGPTVEEPCNESMTCPCKRCVGERAARGPHGGGHQPWHPRPAGQRAA